MTTMDITKNFGESLTDCGFFEIDLIDGRISYINTYVLNVTGYTLSQMKSMNIFNVVPNEYHELLRNSLSDRKKEKHFKYDILPLVMVNNDISWWYTTEIKLELPFIWLKGELLNKTKRNGSDIPYILAIMNLINSHNELISRFESHENIEKIKFDKIHLDIENHDVQIEQNNNKLQHAIKAAERAADESLTANSGIKQLHKVLDDALANQTAEILRLVSTNTIYDARFKSFEENIKIASENAAKLAVSEILKQSEKASTALMERAEEAGKGISRRVTIPIGMLAFIVTIIQIIIQNIKH